MVTKAQTRTDREEGVKYLSTILKPGDTVYTVLKHRSKSGMTRHIDVLIVQDGRIRNISSWVAKAAGYKRAESGALIVGGTGMDMGFHVVYGLSRALYPEGHHCTGSDGWKIPPGDEYYEGVPSMYPRCPSNDHNNDWGAVAHQFEKSNPEAAADYSQEGRNGYASAVSALYTATRPQRYSTARIHRDGGYALTHQWV